MKHLLRWEFEAQELKTQVFFKDYYCVQKLRYFTETESL